MLYTPEQVQALTPVRERVENLAASQPDLRDVFLCHAWDDRQESAKELHDLLEARGVRVWFSEKGYDRGPEDDPQDAKDCREAITQAMADGPIPMSAWLDAAEGGLALQFDLGHAEEACADSVTTPTAVLKHEGASSRLVAALEAAHAAAKPPARVSLPRR